MNFSIPKEVSIEERRISLTPQGVYSLVKEGHTVYIETGAGLEGHFYDEDFQKAGGEIVYSHEEAFKRADLIVKVMPTTHEECKLLEPEQIIFSFLQLGLRASKCMNNLIAQKVTSFGTEMIETENGHKPLLETMSEIAGSMLPQIAGHFLECTHGGRGITISGVPGIPPATIAIIGVGSVGIHAAEAFVALGAQVYVLDKDLRKLRDIDNYFHKRVITLISNQFNIERIITFADVIIGAVYEYGKKPPILITDDLLSSMKSGALLIDVAIDQGGCFETSRPTTHSNPTYVKEGIIHYCVPNIPASVARIASRALNNVILPYLLQIGNKGLQKVLASEDELRRGLITLNGQCTVKNIADLFNLPYQEFKLS